MPAIRMVRTILSNQMTISSKSDTRILVDMMQGVNALRKIMDDTGTTAITYLAARDKRVLIRKKLVWLR